MLQTQHVCLLKWVPCTRGTTKSSLPHRAHHHYMIHMIPHSIKLQLFTAFETPGSEFRHELQAPPHKVSSSVFFFISFVMFFFLFFSFHFFQLTKVGRYIYVVRPITVQRYVAAKAVNAIVIPIMAILELSLGRIYPGLGC